MAGWFVRETENRLIAVGRRSNPRPSRVFANSRLISNFSFAFSSADFCRVLAIVRASPLG